MGEAQLSDLEERNVWWLFNSITHALKGRVMDNPAATPRLHQVLDGCCDASLSRSFQRRYDQIVAAKVLAILFLNEKQLYAVNHAP